MGGEKCEQPGSAQKLKQPLLATSTRDPRAAGWRAAGWIKRRATVPQLHEGRQDLGSSNLKFESHFKFERADAEFGI